MSEETKAMTVEDIDAKCVMEVFGDVERTKRFVAWMDALIEENVTMMTMLVEGGEEARATRLQHLASQISAYRRMKDASVRALQLAGGKPPAGVRADTAVGVV